MNCIDLRDIMLLLYVNCCVCVLNSFQTTNRSLIDANNTSGFRHIDLMADMSTSAMYCATCNQVLTGSQVALLSLSDTIPLKLAEDFVILFYRHCGRATSSLSTRYAQQYVCSTPAGGTGYLRTPMYLYICIHKYTNMYKYIYICLEMIYAKNKSTWRRFISCNSTAHMHKHMSTCVCKNVLILQYT